MVSVSESHDTPDRQCDLHELGNDKDNSMPYCQLNRLMNYLEKLEQIIRAGEFREWNPLHILKHTLREIPRKIGLQRPRRVCFWIDTMCIPVNDEELRRSAIKRMTPTFAGAWRSLLLDSGLLNTSREEGLTDIRATLIRSAWEGRIWTMHESYLAQYLSVRLSNKFFHIKADQEVGMCDTRVSRAVSVELSTATTMKYVGTVEKRGVKLSLREVQLIDVWNDLLGRSTKKAGDGATVFANLLDFYARDVLPLSLNERIKAIFTAQDALPLELLFSRTSRILPDSHLDRWIPKLPGDCWLNPYTKLGSAKLVPGQGMKIDTSGSDKTTVTVWLPPQSRRFTSLKLRGVIEGTEIGVSLHNLNSSPQLCSSDQPRLLMLERRPLSHPGFSHGVHVGSGAILCQPQFEGDFATAVFDSAITFWKLSCFESDPRFVNSPVIGGEVKTLQSILIQSGNLSPLQLTFRMKMTDAVLSRYSRKVQEASSRKSQCSITYFRSQAK